MAPPVKIRVQNLKVVPADEGGRPEVIAVFRDMGEMQVAHIGPVGDPAVDRMVVEFESGRPVYIRRTGGRKQDWNPPRVSGRLRPKSSSHGR
jgi:hypothetical protein